MADIHLAAGLPLTSFGRDKKAFRDYLLRAGGPVTFRYEGESYTITVSDVSLFPQGYAAVLTQPELLDEPSVIVADIGGWTVGSDAPGQTNPQRRHPPQPGVGHDPLCG